MTATQLRLLQQIDAALASRDGLAVNSEAVRKIVAALNEIGQHTEPAGDGRVRYRLGVKPLLRATKADRGRPAMDPELKAKIVAALDAGKSINQIWREGIASYGSAQRVAKEWRE